MTINTYKHRLDYWIYPIYITVSCIFTSGLNIVHTKYILGIAPYPSLFIVPVIAGVIFGYLTARVRLSSYNLADDGEWRVFAKYIFLSSLVTSALNVVHTDWILGERLSAELFIAPMIAGVFFGYLLARIKTLNNKLLKLATTDMLTQLCNRMQFDIYLDQEIEKVKRYGGTLSIIYFDLDNFKEINDEYGHQAGDDVLMKLANQIGQVKRKSDIFARYGGDEFIILAPSTDLQSARKQAELLKQAIEKMDFEKTPGVSCSFGITEYGEARHDINSLINAVDKALYQAKNTGRNCIVTT